MGLVRILQFVDPTVVDSAYLTTVYCPNGWDYTVLEPTDVEPIVWIRRLDPTVLDCTVFASGALNSTVSDVA